MFACKCMRMRLLYSTYDNNICSVFQCQSVTLLKIAMIRSRGNLIATFGCGITLMSLWVFKDICLLHQISYYKLKNIGNKNE